MPNKYIVVYTPTSSGDLSSEEFDDYNTALLFIYDNNDNKAVLVKVENMHSKTVSPHDPPPTTVELEWHT